MELSGACECGCRFDDCDGHYEKCSKRGLRNHAAFRPVCLIENLNEPSVWTYRGWNLNQLTPSRHWAFISEIVSSFRNHLSMSQFCVLKSCFNEKRQAIVRLDELEEPTTFKRSSCVEGNTMVILYPVLDVSEQKGCVQGVHYKDLNTVAVIPASLESVLQYSESMPAKEQACHHCRKPLAEDQWCAKCKTARYCSRECQKAGWKSHKGLCSHTIVIQQLMGLPRAPFQQHFYFEMGSRGLTLTFPKLSARLKK